MRRDDPFGGLLRDLHESSIIAEIFGDEIRSIRKMAKKLPKAPETNSSGVDLDDEKEIAGQPAHVMIVDRGVGVST